MERLSNNQVNDVYDELLKRTDLEDLLGALTLANRQGMLDEMLRSMGQGDLLADLHLIESSRVKKIVVIGASEVKESKLRSIARKYCPESEGYEFEFVLEYHVEKYNFNKLRYNDSYFAVLVGRMPHSTSGKGNSSSVIANMENNPEAWPHLIRVTDGTGSLKITNNSFANALQELLDYQATS